MLTHPPTEIRRPALAHTSARAVPAGAANTMTPGNVIKASVAVMTRARIDRRDLFTIVALQTDWVRRIRSASGIDQRLADTPGFSVLLRVGVEVGPGGLGHLFVRLAVQVGEESVQLGVGEQVGRGGRRDPGRDAGRRCRRVQSVRRRWGSPPGQRSSDERRGGRQFRCAFSPGVLLGGVLDKAGLGAGGVLGVDAVRLALRTSRRSSVRAGSLPGVEANPTILAGV